MLVVSGNSSSSKLKVSSQNGSVTKIDSKFIDKVLIPNSMKTINFQGIGPDDTINGGTIF